VPRALVDRGELVVALDREPTVERLVRDLQVAVRVEIFRTRLKAP
jgi:hypothetical protein